MEQQRRPAGAGRGTALAEEPPRASEVGPTDTADGTAAADAIPASPPRRVAAVLPLPLAAVVLVLTFWCIDIVSPALPALRSSLELSATSAGLVAALFFGGRLLVNLPAALLVDRLGARRTTAVGGGLLLAGSLLAATATGDGTLLPARALQGSGVAFLVSSALVSVLRARPGGGAAMTTFNLGAGVGSGLGLASGGLLTGTVGWRGVFWLSAVLGATLLAAAIASQASGAGRARLAAGAPPAGEGAPWLSPRALVGPLLANLLVYANYSVFVVALPLYAADRFDASAGSLSALLLATNAVHLGAAVPAGRAIRRYGSRRSLAVGFSLATAGLVGMLAVPTIAWLAVPLAVYAIGEVTGNSAAGDLILHHGGRGGKAVGLVRLSSDLGLVLGPAMVGVLADVVGVAAPFVALAAFSGLAAFTAVGAARRVAPRPTPARLG